MDRLISEFEVIRAIEKYVDNIFTKTMGDLINDIKAIPSANALEWETIFDKFMRKQKSKEADMREYWKKELNISSDVTIPSADMFSDLKAEISMYENSEQSIDEMIQGIKSIISIYER